MTARGRPAPWSTGDVGSFAQRTLAERVPRILEDTLARNADAFPAGVKVSCAALKSELVQGRLRALLEDAPDRVAWDAACAPFVGASWLSIPWYFAESYFYRRLLEATEWFGARAGVDPFLPHKLEEEGAMMARVDAVRRTLPPDPSDRLERLLLASLWGNRADLSYAVGRAFGDEGGAADLLVDDTRAAVRTLLAARHVALLLDNAGTELAFDLLLARFLEECGKSVTLFAKAHPFFVSDATPVDVERTSTLVRAAPTRTVAHPYLTSSGFFFTDDLPADLAGSWRAFDVVVAKGDANYRRLVGDAPWPPSTPVDAAVDFPAPVVALRTCKAEVAVGVPDDVAARALARDPGWLTSGRFGMVQVAAASGKAKGP